MRRNSAIIWWITVLLQLSLLTDCFPHMNPRASQQGRSSSNHLQVKSQFQTAVPPKMNEPDPRRQKALSVYCHDEAIEVVLNTDLFAKGLPVYAEELWLGQKALLNNVPPVSCGAVQTGQSQLTIIAHFKDCGTKLSVTGDSLIYSNVLVYSPLPSPDGVLHQDGVIVPVHCQYQRWYNVDSVAVAPAWVPFASTVSDTDFLDFHLRLMTDDWQYERGSNVFFLGNAIHLQASVTLANHLPLLLFIDWCVATPTFGVVVSEVKYSFIDNHGCLEDSRAAYSRSKFLQRTEGNKLNLMLDAFRFHKLTSNLVFITCYLKAIPAMNSVDAQNRACSLIDGRWQSVDGNDEVCNSCEPSKQGVAESEPIMPFYNTPTPLVKKPNSAQRTGPGDFVDVKPGQLLEPFRTPVQSGQYAYGSLSKREADLNKDRMIATLGPLILIPKQETTTQSTEHPQFGPSEVFSTSVPEKPVFINSSKISPMTDDLESNAISEIGNFRLLEDDLFLDDSDLYGSEEGSGFE